jgi:hypothetical protein
VSAAAQRPQKFIRLLEFCVRYGTTLPTARRWIKRGRIKAVHIPPGPRGRIYVLDPEWLILDTKASDEPVEMLYVLRQCDVALLLGISDRALRYQEAAGKTRYQLIGGRKLYAIGEYVACLHSARMGVTKSAQMNVE